MIQAEPEATEIHMDSNHLHQGGWTLCFNALKYGCDAAGAPAVVLAGFQPQDGSAAYLDVIDCGPGIAPELQAQCSSRLTPRARKVPGLARSSRASCARPTAAI
jgi:hypothetical protein